jgi:hypothetical protein
MDRIKIIKKFFTPDECDFYIKYIESNLDKFQETKKSKRFIWLFGDELSMGAQNRVHVNLDLSALVGVEGRVRSLFRSLETLTKEIYKNKNELYVTSFSMTKQIPGAFISPHYDTDGGTNYYFKYSAIIYLNSMNHDGVLEFPELGVAYSPKAGDLLLFPSGDLETLHQVAEISEDRYSLPMWLTEDISWRIP